MLGGSVGKMKPVGQLNYQAISNPIRKCETKEEFDCANQVMTSSLRNSKHADIAPCTKEEYNGIPTSMSSLFDLLRFTVSNI